MSKQERKQAMEDRLKKAFFDSDWGDMIAYEDESWVVKLDGEETLRFYVKREHKFWVLCKRLGFKLYFIDISTCLECLRQVKDGVFHVIERDDTPRDMLDRLIGENERLNEKLTSMERPQGLGGVASTFFDRKNKLEKQRLEIQQKIQEHLSNDTAALEREFTKRPRFEFNSPKADLSKADEDTSRIVLSDDASSDEAVACPKDPTPAEPQLPGLPHRRFPLATLAVSKRYIDGEYLTKHWFGLDKRLTKSSAITYLKNETIVSVSYICKVDLKRPGIGEAWESNAFNSLNNPTGWLTDEVIDVCMGLLDIRQKLQFDETDMDTPRCIFAGTFFHRLFMGDDGMCHLRQATHMNFTEADVFIVPVNCGGSHWVLMVADRRVKEITLYDSLALVSHLDRQNKLERYFNALGVKSWMGEWKKQNTIPPTIPRQREGYNCGLFTIAAADCIAKNRIPSGYDSKDMSRMRGELLRLLHF